ncbi:MAG: hypothetical protein LBD35_05870 [Prevotellaceae bacterium]|jgi:hypothetical protein|nr:hypothetical protein [Prevotellaceae bacterium]
MLIANPIYDVVFKFMMEDKKAAAALIAAIIGEEVLSLEPARIEYTIPAVPASRNKKKPKKKKKAEAGENEEKKEQTEIEAKMKAIANYTVCRLDFTAHISVPGGQKTVHIEVQKAKLSSDIMRFRRYIGAQYNSSGNIYRDNNTDKSRQIYCIFLLGYDIGLPKNPIIHVDNRVTDVVTGKRVKASSNEFINSLHHRSWIIQINRLRKRHRNDLERLLDVFDQKHCWSDDAHYLNVDDEKFPEKYRSVYRRLASAVVSSEMRAMMEAEDDFLEEVRKWERENAKKDMTIEEHVKAHEEKDRTIEEKDRTIEEKDRTIGEKDRAIGEKDRTIGEKDRTIGEKDRTIGEKDRTIGEHVKALEEKDKTIGEKDRYIKELENRFAEMQRTTL